jgi:hypothetical protein
MEAITRRDDIERSNRERVAGKYHRIGKRVEEANRITQQGI